MTKIWKKNIEMKPWKIRTIFRIYLKIIIYWKSGLTFAKHIKCVKGTLEI